MIATQTRLEDLLTRIRQLRIGLLGDLFLDRYLHVSGELREVSIETGREAYQVESIRNAPGALGTVLKNLAWLGVQTLYPITVIGDDGHGLDLMRAVMSLPADVHDQHVQRRADRLTPTYTKPLRPADDGALTELNRLDIRSRGTLSEEATARVLVGLEVVLQQADGLIVLDQVNEQDCGVVNRAVRSGLATCAARHSDKLVLADSRQRLATFQGVTLKGNAAEITAAADESDPIQAARKLSAERQATVICTCGEAGIDVVAGDDHWHAPGYKIAGPIDIVGAGDAVTAALVAGRLAGGSWSEAADLANLVASITVSQIGTTGEATPEQVLARWRQTR